MRFASLLSLALGLATGITTAPTLYDLTKRVISNVPNPGADCGMLTSSNRLTYLTLTRLTGGQLFNDNQIEDAAQRGVDNTRGPGGPQPGNNKPTYHCAPRGR